MDYCSRGHLAQAHSGRPSTIPEVVILPTPKFNFLHVPGTVRFRSIVLVIFAAVVLLVVVIIGIHEAKDA